MKLGQIVRTEYAGKEQRWGRQCNVCGLNYSIIEKYDYVYDIVGNCEKRMSWSASLCACRYVCKYYNGAFVYHDKDHPLYKKFAQRLQRTVSIPLGDKSDTTSMPNTVVE